MNACAALQSLPGLVLHRPKTAGREIGSKDEARYACMQDQPSVSCLETLEYCAPDTRYDLTGSVIRASGKLAVYMGDVCAFVPKTVRLAITWRRARFRARPGASACWSRAHPPVHRPERPRGPRGPD